jgi:hypothetical protein
VDGVSEGAHARVDRELETDPEPIGCDASADMPAPTDTANLIREARTGRLLPGEGVLPLRDLVAALPAGLPLAIEAPSRDTVHLPALERAQRAHRALTALLDGVRS